MASKPSVPVIFTNGWYEIHFLMNNDSTLNDAINHYTSKVGEQRSQLVFLCSNIVVDETTLVSSLKSSTDGQYKILIERRGYPVSHIA